MWLTHCRWDKDILHKGHQKGMRPDDEIGADTMLSLVGLSTGHICIYFCILWSPSNFADHQSSICFFEKFKNKNKNVYSVYIPLLFLMSFICASVINHDITKVMGQ
jgi:hypothetical protein